MVNNNWLTFGDHFFSFIAYAYGKGGAKMAPTTVAQDLTTATTPSTQGSCILWLYGLKPCPHCRRKVRLSLKTARKTATVALFCDSVDRA